MKTTLKNNPYIVNFQTSKKKTLSAYELYTKLVPKKNIKKKEAISSNIDKIVYGI